MFDYHNYQKVGAEYQTSYNSAKQVEYYSQQANEQRNWGSVPSLQRKNDSLSGNPHLTHFFIESYS